MNNFYCLISILIFCLLFASSCTKDTEELILLNEEDTTSIEYRKTNIYGEYCKCETIEGEINIHQPNTTSALIAWEEKSCGSYIIHVVNIDDGTYTTSNTTYPFFLIGNLDPKSYYEVFVSHVGSGLQACVSQPTSLRFSTYPYCPSEGLNTGFISLQFVTLVDNQEVYIYPHDPSGYIDRTNTILNIPLGTSSENSVIGLCYDGNWSSTIHFKLWIDVNDDGVFEENELYLNGSDFGSSSGNEMFCVSGIPFDFDEINYPNVNLCGVRVRCSVSLTTQPDPCGDIQDGQVLDFRANFGGGC